MTARLRLPHLLCAALAVAQVALFRPGIMVWDAIRQYRQALSGRYDDWHPPAMNWLWRQLLPLHAGPAPMLVLQALLYWGGLGLLAGAAWARGRRGRALAIVAIGLMPIPLVLVGTVLKDSLMAGALLAAAGLIAAWPERRAARAAAALLLLAAATLRFNAVPACLPLAYLLVPARWRRTPARRAAALMLPAIPLLLAMPVVNRLLRAEKSGVELSLIVYDLGGITRRSGADAFPPLPLADPVGVNARCYSPVDWDHYAWWGDDPCPIQFAAVRDAFRRGGTRPTLFWARAIAAHPTAYAGHRLAHYARNLRLADTGALHGLSHASDPNPWGFAMPPNRWREHVADAATASLHTPLGWPLVWLAAALLALLLAPREERLGRALAWSALLYGLSYLPLSVATEVRYHLWTTTAAALAAALALGGRLETRGRARLEAAPARTPTRPPNQFMLWGVGWGCGPVPRTRQKARFQTGAQLPL